MYIETLHTYRELQKVYNSLFYIRALLVTRRISSGHPDHMKSVSTLKLIKNMGFLQNLSL